MTQSDGPKNGLASSLAASDFGSSASFYTPVTGHSPGVIQWSHQDRGGISAPCSQPYVLRRWPQDCSQRSRSPICCNSVAGQNDKRLRRFLDLQLKLYSQEPADRTAALYGATVLQMAQAPLGLWHLQGSMQVLSEQLSQAIETAGGEIRLRHRVEAMHPSARGWTVTTKGTGAGAQSQEWHASDVICSLPPQCLVDLLPSDEIPHRYRQRLTTLPEPSGALVLYGVVQRKALPIDCPGHLQRGTEHPGSLFVSISRDGDGRAPLGQATVIASVFTPTADWCELEEPVYQGRKIERLKTMKHELNAWLGLSEDDWIHTELATPRGFAGWTGRPRGMVGGLGQHPSRFGPFGLAGRTPLPGLWLCGDSLYPGEGTAGVTLSALNACRQLMEHRGLQLSFNR